MNVHTYPGKGLSLPQLVFALNEELKRTIYSPSFTFDNVSQLESGVLAALASIREWENSFTHINRIPLDVLSLIPTHLPSQKDLFKASQVCRHWRRTFLQHAVLWSCLSLAKPKREVYVKTLLERARGSPLHIITDFTAPDGNITLLSPHTRQISSLNLAYNQWADIQWFSDVNSGSLPLLYTLKINVADDLRLSTRMDQHDTVSPPSLPLFSNAVNLEYFSLRLRKSSSLNPFVFPNLTTFELSTQSGWYEFKALDLLNFLEASPMLETVDMEITAKISLEDVAQRGVVVLSNVQTFSLFIEDGQPGYELAAHISSPSASYTSLIHDADITTGYDIRNVFPTAASWNRIVHQYTRSSIEVISLEIMPLDSELPKILCTLAFRSFDGAVIRLGLKAAVDDYGNELRMSPEEVVRGVFLQASRTVQDYPLHNAKHLQILHRISLSESDEAIHMAAIVELAKLRHEQGRPFERVTVRAVELPERMAEMLKPWVGEADCCEEEYTCVHDE